MANKTLVQRGLVQYTDPTVSPQDVVLPAAVKLGSTFISSSIRDSRAGNARGATVRLFDATHIRIEWDGALAGGETLTVSYEVYDLDDMADDNLEILFRLQRALALLGENALQDDVDLDDAGNIVSYRLRLFDTRANAEAATVDHPGGLQAGEQARISVTQAVDMDTNDRASLIRVRTHVIDTPGIS